MGQKNSLSLSPQVFRAIGLVPSLSIGQGRTINVPRLGKADGALSSRLTTVPARREVKGRHSEHKKRLTPSDEGGL